MPADKIREMDVGEGRLREDAHCEWLAVHHHCWLEKVVCLCVSESICAGHSTALVWQ